MTLKTYLLEPQILRIMAEFGFDRLQALRHIQSLEAAKSRNGFNKYPLGVNAEINHDVEYTKWAVANPELVTHYGPLDETPAHGCGHMQGRGAA